MTTGSRKPGIFIKSAHRDNDDKNNDNNNNKIIITITTMTLSFNRVYHWRNGCPELNYVIALWVNTCLENAVKPLDTFYSFCTTLNVKI